MLRINVEPASLRSRTPTNQSQVVIKGEEILGCAPEKGVKRMRILIADDNALVRNVLRQVLESHEGWTVCGEAQDGREAIAEAKQCQPDLVLLDLAMPHMSGLLAAKRIAEQLPAIRMIMHTLYDSPSLRSAAKDHGVIAVIPKSDSHFLIATIETLLPTGKPTTTQVEAISSPVAKGDIS